MTTDNFLTRRVVAPSILLAVNEDDPRIVTSDGEVVPMSDAALGDLAGFVGTLREMRDQVDAAMHAATAELASRSDAAGTRTLRADGVKVVLDAPTETVFALDAALADLRALAAERDGDELGEVGALFDQVERRKVVREADHAAIKRLRATGDRQVVAILDQHTHTRPRDKRRATITWEA